MKENITILNFHGEYADNHFYEKYPHRQIDFSELEGTNGYCDEEAQKKIQAALSWDDICFMGNGNYHYISYLRISQIQQEFSLVVFDHHTDMQPSFFEELLSCGCWILWALQRQKYLQKVLLIGVKDELAEEIPEEFASCVEVVRESEWNETEKIKDRIDKILQYPLYISVDKDVFSLSECVTNWDAGSLTLAQFGNIMEMLRAGQWLGADVCGEPERQEKRAGENANDIILDFMKMPPMGGGMEESMEEKKETAALDSWENLPPKERMKWEIAEEIGVMDKVKQGGWKSLSARETGKIGGLLTSRMKAQKKKKDSEDKKTMAADE